MAAAASVNSAPTTPAVFNTPVEQKENSQWDIISKLAFPVIAAVGLTLILSTSFLPGYVALASVLVGVSCFYVGLAGTFVMAALSIGNMMDDMDNRSILESGPIDKDKAFQLLKDNQYRMGRLSYLLADERILAHLADENNSTQVFDFIKGVTWASDDVCRAVLALPQIRKHLENSTQVISLLDASLGNTTLALLLKDPLILAQLGKEENVQGVFSLLRHALGDKRLDLYLQIPEIQKHLKKAENAKEVFSLLSSPNCSVLLQDPCIQTYLGAEENAPYVFDLLKRGIPYYYFQSMLKNEAIQNLLARDVNPQWVLELLRSALNHPGYLSLLLENEGIKKHIVKNQDNLNARLLTYCVESDYYGSGMTQAERSIRILLQNPDIQNAAHVKVRGYTPLQRAVMGCCLSAVKSFLEQPQVVDNLSQQTWYSSQRKETIDILTFAERHYASLSKGLEKKYQRVLLTDQDAQEEIIALLREKLPRG